MSGSNLLSTFADSITLRSNLGCMNVQLVAGTLVHYRSVSYLNLAVDNDRRVYEKYCDWL